MALTARDYSLTGEEAQRAVANGLAGAKWYASPIPRKRMKELMARSDQGCSVPEWRRCRASRHFPIPSCLNRHAKT